MAVEVIDVQDVDFSGVEIFLRLGGTAVAGSKLTFGDSLKVDKTKRFGLQGIGARTMGSYECDDPEIEVETGLWSSIIMPKLNVNGFGQYEFVITAKRYHPEIGQYGVLIDRCRFTEIKDDLEASEKASVVKVKFSAMQVRRKGRDGKWKTINVNPQLPSSTASEFML